jgi:hypothetical protein
LLDGEILGLIGPVYDDDGVGIGRSYCHEGLEHSFLLSRLVLVASGTVSNHVTASHCGRGQVILTARASVNDMEDRYVCPRHKIIMAARICPSVSLPKGTINQPTIRRSAAEWRRVELMGYN